MPFTAEGADDNASADMGDALAVAALALATRFSAGATMWCVAPEWREHARHVAVEFVHPVIVGKRALASVSVDDVNAVESLRALVGAGDAVVVIGNADDRVIHDILRRCPAWGAPSIWIGCGPRPGHAGADHLLWVDDDSSAALFDGRLVFQYHVLWELTHVCLEHPGLVALDDADTCGTGVCVTCSDEGRVGEVVRIDALTATVRTARGIELVDTTIVDQVHVDDLLLIHAGTAIAVLSPPDDAARWASAAAAR